MNRSRADSEDAECIENETKMHIEPRGDDPGGTREAIDEDGGDRA